MTQEIKIEKDGKKGKSAVPSVEKALDILELLASAESGMTMNEMVDALDRTMGEIYRIVVYLTERGYLAQSPESNRYSLTLKLFEISHRHDPTERLISRSIPILERVATLTEQSCHLGVLNRDRILVLASVQSPLPAGYSVRTGALYPVGRTSSGHVILAFSGQETQDRYLKRLPKDTRDDVRRRLVRIRETGYEDTPSMMIDGVRNLCVPVFDSRGIAAAITTGYISHTDQRMSASDVLQTLRTSALELSQALGFRLSESGFETVLLS